jgi:hypothetical protein
MKTALRDGGHLRVRLEVTCGLRLYLSEVLTGWGGPSGLGRSSQLIWSTQSVKTSRPSPCGGRADARVRWL